MRMYLLTLHSVFLAILLSLPGVQSTRWLGIRKVRRSSLKEYLCPSARRRHKNRLLNRKQKKMCRKKPEFMKYVAEAVELTISECLNQTKYERWNCKSIDKRGRFNHDLREGTREAGFLHALSSAALVFSVAQGCSVDKIKLCQCGKKPSKRQLKRHRKRLKFSALRWDQCHDNIAFGVRFSKDFLNDREINQKKRVKMMMNLHDIEAGHEAVRDSMVVHCTCTGKTLACPFKICTRRLPVSFSEIAENLFQRYKNARQVYLKKIDSELTLAPTGDKKKKTPVNSRYELKPKKNGEPVNKKEIVYVHRSRNFCNKDPKRNLPGTAGRECWRKGFNELGKPGPKNSCDYLCCNRGYIKKEHTIKVRCGCKFKWRLMDVRCKQCEGKEEIFTCKS